MLRTMAIQNGVRLAPEAPAREYDPGVVSLIERNPRTIAETAPLSAALDGLLNGQPWGVCVVGTDGKYRGTCTLRSISSLGLLINGETAALMPSLGFLRDDLERIRQRLRSSLTNPALEAIDPFVPTIPPTATLPEIFFHFYRGQSLLPVVEPETRRFTGTIACEPVLRAALNRPSPDGG